MTDAQVGGQDNIPTWKPVGYLGVLHGSYPGSWGAMLPVPHALLEQVTFTDSRLSLESFPEMIFLSYYANPTGEVVPLLFLSRGGQKH